LAAGRFSGNRKRRTGSIRRHCRLLVANKGHIGAVLTQLRRYLLERMVFSPYKDFKITTEDASCVVYLVPRSRSWHFQWFLGKLHDPLPLAAVRIRRDRVQSNWRVTCASPLRTSQATLVLAIRVALSSMPHRSYQTFALDVGLAGMDLLSPSPDRLATFSTHTHINR